MSDIWVQSIWIKIYCNEALLVTKEFSIAQDFDWFLTYSHVVCEYIFQKSWVHSVFLKI